MVGSTRGVCVKIYFRNSSAIVVLRPCLPSGMAAQVGNTVCTIIQRHIILKTSEVFALFHESVAYPSMLPLQMSPSFVTWCPRSRDLPNCGCPKCHRSHSPILRWFLPHALSRAIAVLLPETHARFRALICRHIAFFDDGRHEKYAANSHRTKKYSRSHRHLSSYAHRRCHCNLAKFHHVRPAIALSRKSKCERKSMCYFHLMYVWYYVCG